MLKAEKAGFILIVPAILAMIFIHFLPMLWGFVTSFKEYTVYNFLNWWGAPFNGLENYKVIFNPVTTIGKTFVLSVRNVAIYGFLTTSFSFLLGLGVALLLNQDFVGNRFVKGVILLPYITPDVAVYSLWRNILLGEGLLNTILEEWGVIDSIILWVKGPLALYSVAFASIWKLWPFCALFLLSALKTIPQEVYEAARVDGASAWQRLKYITLPYLNPSIKILVVINVIWNFHAYNQFRIMLPGNAGRYAPIPNTLIMGHAFHWLNYGEGSAMCVYLFLILIIFTVIYIKLFSKKNYSG